MMAMELMSDIYLYLDDIDKTVRTSSALSNEMERVQDGIKETLCRLQTEEGQHCPFSIHLSGLSDDTDQNGCCDLKSFKSRFKIFKRSVKSMSSAVKWNVKKNKKANTYYSLCYQTDVKQSTHKLPSNAAARQILNNSHTLLDRLNVILRLLVS